MRSLSNVQTEARRVPNEAAANPTTRTDPSNISMKLSADIYEGHTCSPTAAVLNLYVDPEEMSYMSSSMADPAQRTKRSRMEGVGEVKYSSKSLLKPQVKDETPTPCAQAR